MSESHRDAAWRLHGELKAVKFDLETANKYNDILKSEIVKLREALRSLSFVTETWFPLVEIMANSGLEEKCRALRLYIDKANSVLKGKS